MVTSTCFYGSPFLVADVRLRRQWLEHSSLRSFVLLTGLHVLDAYGRQAAFASRRSKEAKPALGGAVSSPAAADEVEKANGRYLAARVLAGVEQALHKLRRDVVVQAGHVPLLLLAQGALHQLNELGLARRTDHLAQESAEVDAARGTVVQSDGLG